MKHYLHPLLLVLILVSCLPPTKVEKSWRDPLAAITDTSYNKVLVAALLKNETTRRVVEDKMLKRLKGKGVASYSYFNDNDITEEKAANFKEKLKQDGFDGALVMRLVNVNNETSYVPGTSGFPDYYGGFGGYYYNSWNSFYSPGYYNQDKIYYVETNIYSLKEDKLIWSGITSSLNPSKPEKMFDEVATAVTAKMKNEGFLK
jgi:hypothetical protein